MADDEFDDNKQDGVEPDLDLNEVVRTEAGERLLLGEFYAPSRPPTAGGAEVFGFTFASILEDAPVTGAAAAGSSIRKVSAAARRAPGVTGRMRGASPAAPAFTSPPPRAVTDSWRHRGVLESSEAASHTARRERVLVAQQRQRNNATYAGWQQFAAELPSEADLQQDSFEFAAGHCESSDVRYCSKRRQRGYQTQKGNLLYKNTQINFLPFDYPAFIQYANQ